MPPGPALAERISAPSFFTTSVTAFVAGSKRNSDIAQLRSERKYNLLNPHRIEIIRPLPRHLYNIQRVHVRNPYGTCQSAPIISPSHIGRIIERRSPAHRRIREVFSIRRIRPRSGHRQRQPNRQPAVQRHLEELCITWAAAFAVRPKDHRLPVRCPSHRHIRRWMISESLRNSSNGRNHKHIGIAVIFPGERDHRSIRRKYRSVSTPVPVVGREQTFRSTLHKSPAYENTIKFPLNASAAAAKDARSPH
jgi:hypothetical protein